MSEWLAVFTITLFAVISPGPDFAMTSRNSLLLSRQAGLLTAFGIGIGVLVHVAYTLLGVGVLLSQSPTLFLAVKLLGAGYLIYLGLNMLRTGPSQIAPDQTTAALSGWSAFKTGFFTNVLNPKTTLFVMSLFLQVVNSDTRMLIQLAYGFFISGAHIVWFAIVAVFLSSPSVSAQLFKWRVWIDRAFGAVLVIFGVVLALSNAPL